MERATGIEPVLPTWESEFSILYFQYLQNRSEKARALYFILALFLGRRSMRPVSESGFPVSNALKLGSSYADEGTKL